jgi:hypothetical protein
MKSKWNGIKCVPDSATDDASCAAIDSTKPKFVHGKGCRAAGTDDATCFDNDMHKAWGGSACVYNNCGYDKTCPGADVCSKPGTANPITCVAAGKDDATCLAIDTAKPKWSSVSGNGCVVAGKDDASCAAIDAAKPKWDGSKCVAACACTGTDVCSKLGTANPITCVAAGKDDATCLAIDTAKPKFRTGTGCVSCEIATGCPCGNVCSAANTCIDVCNTAAKKACTDAGKMICSYGSIQCGPCMAGYTADTAGKCTKDAAPTPAPGSLGASENAASLLRPAAFLTTAIAVAMAHMILN